MIRGGFLSEEDRKALIALARDGLAAGRVTRRATALVRLDEGLSCQEVAKVLLFDDDTIRGWYELFEQDGVEGLSRFEMGGSAGKMSAERCDALKAWVETSLPRSTRQVGSWIAKEFGLVYESRSGLIALLHRLGLEYHKPEVISRKLDPKTQKAFIASYKDLLNSKGDDEVAIFVDAVHPAHAARPVFPAHLLPAPEPDRAAMGRHAQEHHPQQMLRDLRRIRGNNPRIPARRGAQKVGRVLRFGHRQFSYNFTQGLSAPGVNRVYTIIHAQI